MALCQSFQSFAKRRVTVRAAQAACFLEIGLRKTAGGAFEIRSGGGLGHLLRRAQSEQQVGQRKAGRIVHALLLGTRLTEVHLLGLAPNHLSEVDCRHVLFADVAKHISIRI